MKKTRLLSFILAMLLLLGALASCGGSETEETSSTRSDTTEQVENVTDGDTDGETDISEQETQISGGSVEVDEPNGDAYYIIEAAAQNGRNGLANGWNYDNRFDLTNTTGKDSNVVYDKTDAAFYRLIRDFDRENDGVLKLEMIIEAESRNGGVYIALGEENDEKRIQITVQDGKWVAIGVDKLVTDISVPEGGQTKKYGIEMIVDMNENTAKVTINNVYCGEIKIPDKPVSRLILGTNKVGTGTIGFSYVRLMKNYPIVDRFILGDVADYEGQAPANWEVEGDFVLDRISSMRLYDMYSVVAESKGGSHSTAYKSFDAASGKLAFETMILLPEKTDGASVSLMSGERAVITFETCDGKIYVGDNMVNDYIANVWQTLHIEADTATGKADIYVNGKNKATVDFSAEAFDGVKIRFAPKADAVMWFDDVEIYPVFEYADYPEEPRVAASDDYNIGMNVCWLWRDQQSGEGWDATSPFSEFDPYLGFYDEGLRETADWELKWMAEHGIDFLHACWYCPSGDIKAPIKEMRHSYAALHDGYMMAEYSDYVDFCIMWENNGQDCTSFEQFREYIWNYWKEYYFSDPRYARLDNKAVLTVWNSSNFVKAFGGETGARKAVKFMESELKDMGYDGIIILVSTTGAAGKANYENWAKAGFDASYGYHWNANGKSAEHQISCNSTNLANSAGIMHHIPTVSIGFNDVGRNETRDPIITVSDHLKVCKNIKSTLAKMNTGTWKDNTLFISTWNEYSEGTYIFPTESTGFEYLENIRQIFTNDESDHSALDVRPTEAQIERVTHLYPDNHSPIRWYQFEKPDVAAEYGVRVNGSKLVFTFAPQPTADGDFIVSGEAKGKGFYSALRLYHEWDRFTGDGVLTLYTYNEDKLVFTVGSDKVIVNGKEQSLGYTFVLRDGLPQFHIKKLCDLIGYKYTVDGKDVVIQAATDEEFALLENKVDNQWEFDIESELQGWRIQGGTAVADGEHLVVTPSNADVAIIHDVNFSSNTYNVVRVGIEYSEFMKSQGAHLFFTTKTSTAYSADKMVSAKYDLTGKKEGDIVELVFELGKNILFSGIITGIRVDPLTGFDSFKVDYVRCEFDAKYDIMSRIVEVDDENQWTFDDGKQGWTLGNAKYRGVEGGFYSAVSTNTDPAMYKTVNFKAKTYQVMIVNMKYNPATAAQVPTLYFRTTDSTSWNETKSIKGSARIPEDIVEGEVYSIVFDLSNSSAWSGTITDLRFDPFNMIGTFEIDSIRLYKIPKEPVEGAVAPTKPTEAVITDPENLPEGITVTSEGTGKIEIVSDPTNASAKVFKVKCIDSSLERYTYLNLFMHFEPGETYTIKYKIMPLTDISGNAFSDTIVGGNLIYGTVESSSVSNHTFDGGSNKSTSDKWIEVTVTVKIPENYSASDNDRFQIWGKFSPTTKKGIDYLVKDISITIED